MDKIIRSTIDFLYVNGNRLSAHKLPMIRPPTGTYYLTYNVTLRQLVSGCLGIYIYTYTITYNIQFLKYIISHIKGLTSIYYCKKYGGRKEYYPYKTLS